MVGLRNSVFVILVVGMTSACDPGGSRALVLPEGDAEHGQELFVEFHCNACHTVRGLDLPKPAGDPEYAIILGGGGVKYYPELVTSVINPSHRVARRYRAKSPEASDDSPMTIYNDVMTVSELVDLVAFLKVQYKVERVPRYRYVPHTYPK